MTSMGNDHILCVSYSHAKEELYPVSGYISGENRELKNMLNQEYEVSKTLTAENLAGQMARVL